MGRSRGPCIWSPMFATCKFDSGAEFKDIVKCLHLLSNTCWNHIKWPNDFEQKRTKTKNSYQRYFARVLLHPIHKTPNKQNLYHINIAIIIIHNRHFKHKSFFDHNNQRKIEKRHWHLRKERKKERLPLTIKIAGPFGQEKGRVF